MAPNFIKKIKKENYYLLEGDWITGDLLEGDWKTLGLEYEYKEQLYKLIPILRIESYFTKIILMICQCDYSDNILSVDKAKILDLYYKISEKILLENASIAIDNFVDIGIKWEKHHIYYAEQMDQIVWTLLDVVNHYDEVSKVVGIKKGENPYQSHQAHLFAQNMILIGYSRATQRIIDEMNNDNYFGIEITKNEFGEELSIYLTPRGMMKAPDYFDTIEQENKKTEFFNLIKKIGVKHIENEELKKQYETAAILQFNNNIYHHYKYIGLYFSEYFNKRINKFHINSILQETQANYKKIEEDINEVSDSVFEAVELECNSSKTELPSLDDMNNAEDNFYVNNLSDFDLFVTCYLNYENKKSTVTVEKKSTKQIFFGGPHFAAFKERGDELFYYNNIDKISIAFDKANPTIIKKDCNLRKNWTYLGEPNKCFGNIKKDINKYIFTVANEDIGDNITNKKLLDIVEPEMVLVEGGTFIMGAADSDIEAFDFEKPAHQVTLDSYKIGKFPVTQKQWESIMETNPSYYKSEDRPVERVTWHDAQDFIAQLNATTGKNYRLPTEAEWEFAARGGNESKGYEYSGSNEVNEVAWHELTTLRTGTQPVGKRKANELGIYDMSGNVNEWCNDWFGLYVHSHQTNPQGPTSGQYRVIRGGSCNTYAEGCKVISRPHVSYFGTCSREIGLRLVLPIEANEDMDDSTNI